MSALIKPRVIGPLLAAATWCVLAGPIVATASASDGSIIRVVNHWSPIVKRDESRILKAESAYKHDRRAGPVVGGLRHEVSDLHHLAAGLKHQSASGSIGAKGRDEIAAGALLVAKSYTAFAKELHKAGPRGLSLAEIKANSKVALAGHHKIVSGVKQLKRLG